MDATVIAQTGDQKQYRRVRAGHSYASQSESLITFGLGSNMIVDTVTVRWPSGFVSQRTNVRENQTLQLRER